MPATEPPTDVTDLLLRWNSGDREALDSLTPLVYHELKRLAGRARCSRILQKRDGECGTVIR